MGGRRSYIIDDVLGKQEKVRNKIIHSAKEHDQKKFAQTVIESYVKSEKTVSDIKLALLGFKLLKEYHGKKGLDRIQRKEIASDFWANERDTKNLKTTKKFDNLIVDLLTKSLPKSYKGGQKK